MKAGLMLGVNPESKREDYDFYATDPYALKIAIPYFEKQNILNKNDTIFEISSGLGHLSNVLLENGYNVICNDLIKRTNDKDWYNLDFLKLKRDDVSFNNNLTILTNPPFKIAKEFVEHSMDILNDNEYAIFFLKIQFLETPKRKEMFKKYPPKYVYVNSERIACAMNGDFDKYFKQDKNTERYCGGTQLYCWYVFQKGYKGETILKWI